MINDAARDVIRALHINVFVETGLHEGETVGIVRSWFPALWIISLELDADKIAACRPKYPDVCYVEGSSERNLKILVDAGVFSGVDHPFFYLDAHWNPYCPLIDEIEQVLRIPGAVLAIDDFEMSGTAMPFEFGHDGKMHRLDSDFIREHVPRDRADAVYRPLKPNAHNAGMCFVFLDRPDIDIDRLRLPLTKEVL